MICLVVILLLVVVKDVLQLWGKIKQILDEHNIKYLEDKEYFKDLKTSDNGIGRYDFILFEDSHPYRLIEYDGEFHYKSIPSFGGEESLNKTIERDKIKNEYAKKHNLPLVRIPYTEQNNITFEILMSNKYLIT